MPKNYEKEGLPLNIFFKMDPLQDYGLMMANLRMILSLSERYVIDLNGAGGSETMRRILVGRSGVSGRCGCLLRDITFTF